MHDSNEKNVQTSVQTVDDKEVKQESYNSHLENPEMFMPLEPIPRNSLYSNWGHRAFFNYLLGKAAVKRLYPLVPHTFVPIIKLCSDNKEDVDAAYKRIKEMHEKGKFFESPREKYRKIYGNYIREIEWSCRQLRKYFTKRAFEDLIIDSTLLYIKEVMGKYIVKMNKMMLHGITLEILQKKPDKRDEFLSKILTRIMNFNLKYVFNVAGWLIGDVEVPEYNARTRAMVMKVTDCLMLRAPRMKQLPEEACLLA